MDKKSHHSNGKQPSNEDAGKANLVGRIEASASGLMQSSFARSSPGAVAESLASLNPSAAKGSSSSSAVSGSETSLLGSGATDNKSAASGAYSTGEFFRSNVGNSTQHGQYSFDEFIAGRGVALPENNHIHSNQHQDGAQTVPSEGHPQQGRQPLKAQYYDSTIQKDGAEELAKTNIDGAAVIALLSDPKFDTEEPPRSWAFEADEQNERIDRGHHVNGRPADAIIPHQPIGPLGLVPDLGVSAQLNNETDKRKGKDVPSKHTNSGLFDSGFGNQSWLDIINNYHDEVWGDMLPLVQEARKEVEEAQSDMQDLQNRPAIRRLKLLLQHLKHPIVP